MNRFKKVAALLALLLVIPYVTLNLYGYITIGGVPVKPIPVAPQYENAFDNTCAVYTEEGGATGICLDTGFILTSRHVVDLNSDGDLDWNERFVRVEFYSDVAEVHTAIVLHVSKGESDFAVITAPHKNHSGVKLMSDADYEHIAAGMPIFAIGRSGGMNPPHFTDGIKSTDLEEELLDRAAITIFYGNSGGGLFDEASGELIGLAARIRYKNNQLIPNWAEYSPADVIRKELKEVGLGHVVDKPQTPVWPYYTLFLSTIALATLSLKLWKKD